MYSYIITLQCYRSVTVVYTLYIYFDSLALKRLRLYVNLLGPYVAYSQPCNLVYK
jgi:hypothetical protein